MTDMQTLNTLKCSHKSISKKHPGYQHCASKPHLENEEEKDRVTYYAERRKRQDLFLRLFQDEFSPVKKLLFKFINPF